jgi:Flp pilus assembly pilin Flp
MLAWRPPGAYMKSQILRILSRFAAERAGATAIEYALIGGLVSIVIVFSITEIGQALLGMLNQVVAAFGG